MFEAEAFVKHPKAILIAPAGFGKTHSIAEAMGILKHSGKHLILTHTHAGIASLKEKLKKQFIPAKSFHVETISGFAQRYVHSFCKQEDLPEFSDKDYFKTILKLTNKLFSLKPIQRILSRSYDSLFVDEYQDCTEAQHNIILLLSELFPTRFLGDPLQGIFQFDATDPIVDLECATQMGTFLNQRHELVQPQRWLRGNNENLGLDLKKIRAALLEYRPINLNLYPSIEYHQFDEADIHLPNKPYYRFVSKILDEKNLLILHPVSSSIGPRLNLVKKFSNRFVLLESIDDKDFYKLALKFDQHKTGQSAVTLQTVCQPIFNKTELDKWFNLKGLISKTKPEDKNAISEVKKLITELDIEPSYLEFKAALIAISQLPKIKCYRKEIFQCLCKALDLAYHKKITVNEAMIEVRDGIRRFGRKANLKCIGTTLLTKGLEFDTVLILDAQKFECRKHLYVAFTRASKRLIVISNNQTLTMVR